MNIAERISWYAERTGLSKAQVQRYRKQLVSSWTTDADRKIASSFRFIERLANDEELSWADWETQAGRLLGVIEQFVARVFDTIKDFVSHVADAVTLVVKALTKLLRSLEPHLQWILPLVPAARAFISR